MKKRLSYLFAILVVFLSLGVGLLPPTAQADPLAPSTFPSGSGSTSSPSGNSSYCNPLNTKLCQDGFTKKPVKITKACPSSLYGFPTIESPNLINLPHPTNIFVQCEIYWANTNKLQLGDNYYVPGMPENGGGGNSGVADYCHRNFTSSYLDSCNKGYADGPGADCGSDKVCKVGAYARAQLDAMGQNNSTLNPTSEQAREYCKGKTGSKYRACVAGYNGQNNGKDKDDACNKFRGDDKNVCQAAWERAKSDSGDDSGGGVACNLGIGLSVGGVLNAINPLNWLLCGLVQGLNGVVTELDDQINNILALDTDQIFGNDGYEKSWSKFKNIALGLLVVVSLIVVIAQAVGMEIVDAYTIRKMLPRILIATVAIVLSWQLMKFSVNLANDLGWGVKNLIESSFPGSSTVFDTGGAEGLLLGLAGALGVAVFGIFGLMSFAGTAAIAVIITFLVLVLRQIAIIMMMVFAPIAILAYVLPNTQRVYKFWWESFSKMLLMFPMIVGFIAIGHVFSGIADGSALFINQVIAFIAYFGPYFAIPLTFRFAGSVMGTMGNAVNSRGEGARNWLGKKRTERAALNMKRIRSGQRWNQDFGRFKNPITGKRSSIGNIANRAAVNVFDQDELLPHRLGKPRGKFGGVWGFKRGSAKLQDAIDDRYINESMKGYQEVEQAGGLHYEGWRALAGDYSHFKGYDSSGTAISDRLQKEFTDKDGNVRAPSSLGDFRAAAGILQESSKDKERLGGGDLAARAGTLSTIKTQPDMEYADSQLMASVALSAAGRADPDALAGIGNSVKGRLGGSVAQRVLKNAARAGTRNRPDIRDGHGIVINSKGQYESAYKNPTSETAVGSVMSVKGSDWSGAKAEAVTSVKDTLAHIARGGTGNEAEQKTIQEAIVQGIVNPYNDAGQRKAWMEVASSAGYKKEDIDKLHGRAGSLGDASIITPPDDGGGTGTPGAPGA